MSQLIFAPFVRCPSALITTEHLRCRLDAAVTALAADLSAALEFLVTRGRPNSLDAYANCLSGLTQSLPPGFRGYGCAHRSWWLVTGRVAADRIHEALRECAGAAPFLVTAHHLSEQLPELDWNSDRTSAQTTIALLDQCGQHRQALERREAACLRDARRRARPAAADLFTTATSPGYGY